MVVECELKSPFVPPFSKEGIFSVGFSPLPSRASLRINSVEGRGRGNFLGGIEARNYVENFSYRTPDSNFGRFWFDLSTHP
jgi:hypothetical protein